MKRAESTIFSERLVKLLLETMMNGGDIDKIKDKELDEKCQLLIKKINNNGNTRSNIS